MYISLPHRGAAPSCVLTTGKLADEPQRRLPLWRTERRLPVCGIPSHRRGAPKIRYAGANFWKPSLRKVKKPPLKPPAQTQLAKWHKRCLGERCGHTSRERGKHPLRATCRLSRFGSPTSFSRLWAATRKGHPHVHTEAFGFTWTGKTTDRQWGLGTSAAQPSARRAA